MSHDDKATQHPYIRRVVPRDVPLTRAEVERLLDEALRLGMERANDAAQQDN